MDDLISTIRLEGLFLFNNYHAFYLRLALSTFSKDHQFFFIVHTPTPIGYKWCVHSEEVPLKQIWVPFAPIDKCLFSYLFSVDRVLYYNSILGSKQDRYNI